jgi:serine/threonine protein kinase
MNKKIFVEKEQSSFCQTEKRNEKIVLCLNNSDEINPFVFNNPSEKIKTMITNFETGNSLKMEAEHLISADYFSTTYQFEKENVMLKQSNFIPTTICFGAEKYETGDGEKYDISIYGELTIPTKLVLQKKISTTNLTLNDWKKVVKGMIGKKFFPTKEMEDIEKLGKDFEKICLQQPELSFKTFYENHDVYIAYDNMAYEFLMGIILNGFILNGSIQNLVYTYDYSLTNGNQYILTEYQEMTLEHFYETILVLKNEKNQKEYEFMISQLNKCIIQIVCTLVLLNLRGIRHLLLKPSSVYISPIENCTLQYKINGETIYVNDVEFFVKLGNFSSLQQDKFPIYTCEQIIYDTLTSDENGIHHTIETSHALVDVFVFLDLTENFFKENKSIYRKLFAFQTVDYFKKALLTKYEITAAFHDTEYCAHIHIPNKKDILISIFDLFKFGTPVDDAILVGYYEN